MGSVSFYQGKIGADIIALKLGEKGCLLFDGKELIREYGIAVDVVDPTGAGDAFNAGVIYGVMRGLDLKKTARLANIVGALSTTRLGAGQNLPTREEMIEFLKKSSEKELPQLFERGCTQASLQSLYAKSPHYNAMLKIALKLPRIGVIIV